MSQNDSHDGSFGFPMGGQYRKFSDPFLLPSSFVMPQDHVAAMDYAAFLYFMNQPYAKATQRTSAYFATDIQFKGGVGSPKEQEELYQYYTDQLDVVGFLRAAADDVGCYGNAFARIHFPFIRFLVDTRRGWRTWALDSIKGNITFDITTMTYHVPDPAVYDRPPDRRPLVRFKFIDLPSYDVSLIRLRLMDPRFVHLEFSDMTGDTNVIYKFPPEFRRQIRSGVLAQVNTTPAEMLETIRDNQDFRFDKDAIFHLKSPTITGVTNSGWGMPGPFAVFRSLFQMQVYRKVDEALALDYMVPLRIVAPKMGNGNGAVDEQVDLGKWKHAMRRIFDTRKTDPFAMHTVPFDVSMHEFSASGKALSPKDLMAYQQAEITDSAGYPIEIARGTMSLQGAPMALRLFGSQYHWLHRGMDRMFKWINFRVSHRTNRQVLTGELQLPTMADDLEARHIYMQLAGAGEISRQRAFQAVNLDDPVAEFERRLTEDMQMARLERKQQMQIEREFTLGSGNDIAAAAADSGGAVPETSAMPADNMDQKAEEYAQQIITNPEEGRRILQYLRETNPHMHALVLEVKRRQLRQAEQQGRAQLTEQPAA